MAANWNTISPACYKQVASDDCVTLPVQRHLRRITSALNTDLELAESSVKYLKARKEKLKLKDLKVALLLDEVHSKASTQYLGGKFYGLKNGVVIKTLLCTMIKSVAGSYRDIVSMSPIANISGEQIVTIWNNVVKAMTNIGFEVVLTMNDQHSSNVKFFQLILKKSLNLAFEESRKCGIYIPNPFDIEKKIFLAFDTVHVFKNLYSNFERYKTFEFPQFSDEPDIADNFITADFNHLQQLYDIEVSRPERKAFKLTYKILHPKSIEKTNTQLAVGCFHESTIHALRYYAKHGYPQFTGTADFLQIVHDWFNIFNVKSLYAGQKSRDRHRDPIYKDSEFHFNYLEKFIRWLVKWEKSKRPGFSAQTFQSAKITTLSMLYLVKYLLEDPLIDYVLLGLISSDYLESRFGWFRQLCGADYFNAVLQFLQAEKRIRLRLLVKSGYNMSDIKDIFNDEDKAKKDQAEIESHSSLLLEEINDYKFENLESISESDRNTIFYTSGYIGKSILKQVKCCNCKDFLTTVDDPNKITEEIEEEGDAAEYLEIANRGGLTKPSDVVYMACVHAWAFYSRIAESESSFQLLMNSPNPRSVFVLSFMEKMQLDECTAIYNSKCSSGCQLNKEYLKKIAHASFNLKAKNFVAKQNDKIAAKKRRNPTGDARKSGDARKIVKMT